METWSVAFARTGTTVHVTGRIYAVPDAGSGQALGAAGIPHGSAPDEDVERRGLASDGRAVLVTFMASGSIVLPPRVPLC